MGDMPEFVTERTFDAPRSLVWKAWTDPVLLARWYGPGIDTIIHEFDLRVGGVWRNEMRKGEWSDLSMMTFQEIVPEEKLVWLHVAANTDWNPTTNPMMPDWPRELLTTVTFVEAGDKTDVRLVWTPHNASAAEIACFEGAVAGFGKGWGAGFDIITDILAELQA